MLQQTNVTTVMDYYERFLRRFPTVDSLASADQQDVLQMWSGLGYYSRARNAHRAAQQIVEYHCGRFPTSVDQLQKLPGIGRYTAGAIASMAFDQPAPILETNTIRLFSRLIMLDDPVQSSIAQKQFWEVATAVVPKRSGAGLVNQALMELGSLICTPKSPACCRCPLRRRCRAYTEGKQLAVPVLKSKPVATPLTHVGLVIQNHHGDLLLRLNSPGQWWEGLWDLPWLELPAAEPRVPSKQDFAKIQRGFRQIHQLPCQLREHHQSILHSVTRYRIHYHCLWADLSNLDNPAACSQEGWRWASLDQLPPVTARFRRLRLPKA